MPLDWSPPRWLHGEQAHADQLADRKASSEMLGAVSKTCTGAE